MTWKKENNKRNRNSINTPALNFATLHAGRDYNFDYFLNITKNIACIEFIRENTCMEILEEGVPQMKVLCHKWDDLKDHFRGFHIGFIIEKYGIEIFAPVAGMNNLQLENCAQIQHTNCQLHPMSGNKKRL